MNRRIEIKRELSFLMLLMFMVQFATGQDQIDPGKVLRKIWESPAEFMTPESAYYDTDRDIIYVSNINSKPAEKDGNGFISKLGTNGKIIELKWVEGLNAPKGIGLLGNKLFVTDIDELVVINIEDGKISRRYPVDGAMFLNDVAIDEKGNVFFSDMQTNSIHKLEKGMVPVWLQGDEIKPTNGLIAVDGELLVGCSKLLKIDIQNKKISVLQDSLESGIDGIAMDAKGRIVFSHWKGKVFLLNEENQPINILDTSAENIQSADIFIIHDNNILLVPTFFDNRVVAYRISR
ncbi:MAG: hypothetical protein U5Q03_01040 [Bacteroidota bacterium]|nr:hypothetical protein [Bacteroidota bacterium]